MITWIDGHQYEDARRSRAEEVGDGVVTGVQAETRQVSEITELLGVAPAERT